MDPRSFLFDGSAHRRNMLFLGNTDTLFHGAKRVPFCSSPEDMFGNEYYDEQSPEKKRRLSSDQVYLLEKTFETENKLEPDTKADLAKKLGLQPRQVAIWFQNRRARWKTKQLERDYDHLKSSYDALLIKYGSTVKDNEKLRTEVTSLNEKLQSRGAASESRYTGGKPCIDPPKETPMKLMDDGLSSGSRGSSVFEEECPLFVDISDSYFLGDKHTGLIDEVKSEEYHSIGGDRNYVIYDMFGEQQVTMGLWAWP